MENLNVRDKVKYSGKLNNWTFSKKLDENCKGIIVGIINANGQNNYQVKFDNGITASLEREDLEVVR